MIKKTQFSLASLLLLACVLAVPAPSTADTVNIMMSQSHVNLGDYVSFQINATDTGVVVPESRCWYGSFRWSDNSSEFELVNYYEFVEECSTRTGHVTTLNDDCYIYTNSLGRLGAVAYIDPSHYQFGDIGRISIGCGEGYNTFNFTVDNYRPSDSFFGGMLQYLIDNPESIFGLFVFMLVVSVLLVIVLILPIIILRRLFS